MSLATSADKNDIFLKIVFSRQVATYVTVNPMGKASRLSRERGIYHSVIDHNSRERARASPTAKRGESTSVIARHPEPNARHFSSVSEHKQIRVLFVCRG